MFGSLKEKAAGLAGKAVDAVSDIDVDGIKGKVTTTVSGTGNKITQSVTMAAERVKDRVSDPADAYDAALNDVLLNAEDPAFAGRGLKELVAGLQAENPYRS